MARPSPHVWQEHTQPTSNKIDAPHLMLRIFDYRDRIGFVLQLQNIGGRIKTFNNNKIQTLQLILSFGNVI